MEPYRPHAASAHTRRILAGVHDELPFSDTRDVEEAHRGFLGTADLSDLRNAAGHLIWDQSKYAFLDTTEAEENINPSLLRQARLNRLDGLFEVTEGVYQVRGFDLSNVTFLEGDTGVIVIDPLVSVETARAALALYREHRGDRAVSAVIYTHSHADHYGGVRGVVDPEDVASGRVRVIAPEHFLQEAVAENVFAGNAMQRRTIFQYGYLLPGGPFGAVDAGLGKELSNGSVSLIAPTEHVRETGEVLHVDGIEIEFIMAPHTEAPSEFMMWLPRWRLLNSAEDVTHTIHNLLTLRGAQVRDAVSWWKALHELLIRYGNRAEILIAQHHWPVWGNDRVRELIGDQRDLYKYLHDEVLRLVNHGHTIMEIPELLELPDAIGKKWHNRGYYGSVHHNAKAIYQRYLGWWDGNPSTFYAHPPAESAKRFVELAGGADQILERIQPAFDAGDYRWVAEVANKLVFADPSDSRARELGARALEQLGYQTENPTWRNAFLNGAKELIDGPPAADLGTLSSLDVLTAMTPELLLDFLGIRVNGPQAAATPLRLLWTMPDEGSYLLELRHGLLLYTADPEDTDELDAELAAVKDVFAALAVGALDLDSALADHGAQVTGRREAWGELFALLDDFPQMFAVVTP